MAGAWRVIVSAAVTSWVALAAPVTGPAAEAPAPQVIAALRDSLSREKHARLLGTFGTREITRPVADSAGVGSADWAPRKAQRGAIFVAADAPPPAVPRPIPWSEIAEVQAGGPMTGRGALIGGLVGAFAGTIAAMAVISTADPTNESAGLGAAYAIPTTALIGVFVGASIGSHGRWRTVYRAGDGPAP